MAHFPFNPLVKNPSGTTTLFEDGRSGIGWNCKEYTRYTAHASPGNKAKLSRVPEGALRLDRELSWDDFRKKVTSFEENPRCATEVTVITWDRGIPKIHSHEKYAPANLGKREVILRAAIVSIDETSRSFTISNCLNDLGNGNSGAVVVLDLNSSESVVVGQVNAMANHCFGFRERLRCVRSDTRALPYSQIARNDEEIAGCYSHKGISEVKFSKHSTKRGLGVSLAGLGYARYDISPNPHDNWKKYKKNVASFYDQLGQEVRNVFEKAKDQTTPPNTLSVSLKFMGETYTLKLRDFTKPNK